MEIFAWDKAKIEKKLKEHSKYLLITWWEYDIHVSVWKLLGLTNAVGVFP